MDSFRDLGFARVDTDREARQGAPEAIVAEGKTPEEISAIATALLEAGSGSVLVTRADKAAREAVLRQTNLVVIHVTDSLDLDKAEAQRAGVSDEVDKVIAEGGFADLSWHVELSTGSDDIAGTVVELAAKLEAEILVIGARRRSPIGKFLLGSSAQSIILEAAMPVLVVKPPA